MPAVDPHTFTCASCGKEFSTYGFGLRKRKYCSQECYQSAPKLKGEDCPNFKTGKKITHGGMQVQSHGNRRANAYGYVFEHLLVAERAMGKPVPIGAAVHHVNGNPLDNRPDNLVVCENNAFHLYLHARTRIVRAGGSPRIHKICSCCKRLLPRSDFNKSHHKSDGLMIYCNDCRKAKRQAKKEAA